jgi:hypothetical protein
MSPVPPEQQPQAPPPRGPHDRPTRPHGQANQQTTDQHRYRRVIATPHQRHGDRGSGDDDSARLPLPVYVRYADLEAARIVNNWTTLLRLIDAEGFPPGVMIGPNTRAWRADEVERWLAERPSARKAIPPDARHPRSRKRVDAADAEQNTSSAREAAPGERGGGL